MAQPRQDEPMFQKIAIALLLAVLCLAPAHAVTFEWTDPVSGFFDLAGNWTPAGGPPGAGDNVVFNESGVYDIVLKLDHTSDEVLVTDGDVRLLSNTAAVSTLTLQPDGGLTDADIEVNGGSSLTIGNVGSPVLVDGEDAILFAGVTTSGTVSVVGTGSKLVANGTSRTHPIGAVGGIGVLIVASGGQADIGMSGGVLDIGVSNTGSSQGFVLVDTGGLLRTDTLSVGTRTSAAEGTVTVSGSGSTIATGSGATIGSTSGGTGTINVESAGTFSTNSLTVRATGTLNVLDGNVFSSLTTLAAGGTVLIDGGQYFSQAGFDNSAGGTLTHRDGLLKITEGAFVPSASGNYTIDGAAVADSPNLAIGFGGTAAFGFLEIGANQSATLTVEDGGFAFTGNAILGDKPDARGIVNVTDSDSHLSVTSLLTVGFQGDGSIDISNAGLLTTDTAVIGNSNGSVSEIRVREIDSRLHVQDDLYVGGGLVSNGGDGTLFVETGGTVDVDDQLKVWSDGEVRLTGGTLNLGGDLVIDGGLLTYVSGALDLGENRSHQVNNGTLNFNGSTLSLGNGNSLLLEAESNLTDTSLSLGNGSAGTLILDNSSIGHDTMIFTNVGATGGTANVTLRNESSAQVGTLQVASGVNATATIDIEAGSSLSADSILMALNSSSSATINVAGTLSSSDIAQLTVGSAFASVGTATINLDAGTLRTGAARINTTGVIDIDQGGLWEAHEDIMLIGGEINLIDGDLDLTASKRLDASLGGQLNVTGGLNILSVDMEFDTESQLNISSVLGIGGNGSLTLRGGSTAGSQLSGISDGVVTVTGAGSQWQHTKLDMGNSSTAVMSIFDGGKVLSSSANLALASGGGRGEATVTINGAGSAWVLAGDLNLGGLSSSDEGDAILNLASGGQLEVGGQLLIQGSSVVNLNGGTLVAQSVDHTKGGTISATTGTLDVDTFNGDLTNAGATLHFDTFNGNLTNVGGTLAPGNSAGSTTIVGNYTQQTDGVLEIEIGGTLSVAEFDVVSITGSALVDGNLAIALIDSFVPDESDTFAVLGANSIAGFFDNVVTGQRLSTLDGLGSFVVNYGVGSAFAVNQLVLSNFLASQPGDADGDGDVDGADFLLIQRTDPSQIPLWQANYGTATMTPSATAVPEPTSSMLLAISMLTVMNWSSRKQSD